MMCPSTRVSNWTPKASPCHLNPWRRASLRFRLLMSGWWHPRKLRPRSAWCRTTRPRLLRLRRFPRRAPRRSLRRYPKRSMRHRMLRKPELPVLAPSLRSLCLRWRQKPLSVTRPSSGCPRSGGALPLACPPKPRVQPPSAFRLTILTSMT